MRPCKYPWKKMRVGSIRLFAAPDEQTRNRVKTAAHVWGRYNGCRFATKTIEVAGALVVVRIA